MPAWSAINACSVHTTGRTTRPRSGKVAVGIHATRQCAPLGMAWWMRPASAQPPWATWHRLWPVDLSAAAIAIPGTISPRATTTATTRRHSLSNMVERDSPFSAPDQRTDSRLAGWADEKAVMPQSGRGGHDKRSGPNFRRPFSSGPAAPTSRPCQPPPCPLAAVTYLPCRPPARSRPR